MRTVLAIRSGDYLDYKCQQEKMRGQSSGCWPGYVMSMKVIFRRAEVFVLAEVCLPRRPHAVLPRSQVLSEKTKWWRTWSFKHQTEIGLHKDVLEDGLPLV